MGPLWGFFSLFKGGYSAFNDIGRSQASHFIKDLLWQKQCCCFRSVFFFFLLCFFFLLSFCKWHIKRSFCFNPIIIAWKRFSLFQFDLIPGWLFGLWFLFSRMEKKGWTDFFFVTYVAFLCHGNGLYHTIVLVRYLNEY